VPSATLAGRGLSPGTERVLFTLVEVERGWRDMKQVIDLRPVYHRREDRIRAHVILCWLALLLIRVAENTADQPWAWIRAELQR